MEVKEVPAPAIQDERDVIVRITATGICGSDLHLYKTEYPPIRVISSGMSRWESLKKRAVKSKTEKGDRVVIPFNIGCGECHYCKHQMESQCDESNPNPHTDAGGLFGFRSLTEIIPADRLNIYVFLTLISLLFWFRQTVSLKMSRCCFCQMSCRPPLERPAQRSEKGDTVVILGSVRSA